MNPLRLLNRWWRRATPASHSGPATSRLDVRPPAPWGQAESVWGSLWQWLQEHRDEPVYPSRTLLRAREDFCSALHGLCSPDAVDLRQRGGHARSLREIWHLRPELFGLIARQTSQAEAERRLQAVNRHFPVNVLGSPARSSSPHHDTIA